MCTTPYTQGFGNIVSCPEWRLLPFEDKACYKVNANIEVNLSLPAVPLTKIN